MGAIAIRSLCLGRREKMQGIFASKPAKWAPGIFSADDWLLWLSGKKQIERTADAPKLEFTSPLFRRRLSQLSRMTVQVVHDALEEVQCGDIKQIFASFRGEIKREMEINRQIISDGEILPASFSLSVFNAPIAAASIACALKSGYTALTPSPERFSDAIFAAAASLLSGAESDVLFVYADELVGEEYGNLRPEQNEPLSFACVLSRDEKTDFKRIDLTKIVSDSPQDFLKRIM